LTAYWLRPRIKSCANPNGAKAAINVNHHFYHYAQPRRLETIDADLKKTEDDILRLLNKVTK